MTQGGGRIRKPRTLQQRFEFHPRITNGGARPPRALPTAPSPLASQAVHTPHNLYSLCICFPTPITLSLLIRE